MNMKESSAIQITISSFYTPDGKIFTVSELSRISKAAVRAVFRGYVMGKMCEEIFEVLREGLML